MDRLLRLLLLPVLLSTLLSPPAAQAAETTAPAVLLVAKPELQDPNFAESVVLVIFPREGGPLGVVLNHPTRLTLMEAFPNEPLLKTRGDTLYLGGPVRMNALMYLFQRGAPPENAFPVMDDLWLSGDGRLLDEMLSGSGAPVQQYFLGYAGWTSAQLDFEIAQGAWYVLPADLDTVAGGPADRGSGEDGFAVGHREDLVLGDHRGQCVVDGMQSVDLGLEVT
jgi:putative transcriptional regulator